MTAITFDSLKYVERLTTAGVSESQAKAMSEAQREVFSEMVENHIATKLDIAGLNNKIDLDVAGLNTKIDVDISGLNSKMDIAVASVNNKIDVAIASLNNKIDVAIASLNNRIDVVVAEFNGKFNLLYWMMGFLLALNIAIVLKLFLA